MFIATLLLHPVYFFLKQVEPLILVLLKVSHSAILFQPAFHVLRGVCAFQTIRLLSINIILNQFSIFALFERHLVYEIAAKVLLFIKSYYSHINPRFVLLNFEQQSPLPLLLLYNLQILIYKKNLGILLILP